MASTKSFTNQKQPFASIGLLCLTTIAILAMGYTLDHYSDVSLKTFASAYSISSFFGTFPVVAFVILRKRSWISTTTIIGMAFLIWRISFFPIMVIAGYFTTLFESVFTSFTIAPVIVPILLLNTALLHATTMIVACSVLNANTTRRLRILLLSIALPLLLLAGIVSFSNKSDWRLSPYSLVTINAHTTHTQHPTINPYPELLQQDSYSWQQRVLLYTGLITYELIPSNGHWTQQVKGTLEYDLKTIKKFESRFFTLSHLNAYWLANRSGKQ